MVQTFEVVSSEELAFAMALFVSSANHQFRPVHSMKTEAERRDFETGRQMFLALSFGTLEAVSEEKKATLLRTPLFHAFTALWGQYARDPRRSSLCARVLGFCCLMEKTRGTIVASWVIPSSENPEQVILDPVVVEAIATTQLSDRGVMSERVLLADIHRRSAGISTDTSEIFSENMEEDPNAWPIGASKTAGLMRSHDWSQSSLGHADNWPQCLRTAIDLTLACHFPMIVLWGPDLIQFYNDAYRDIMGIKHPAGFGQPTQECWSEVWHINEPIYQRVLRGETVTFEDQLFPITRYGFLEEAYFTLCYSPVRSASGLVAGVLVTVFETTSRIQAGVEAANADLNREETGDGCEALRLDSTEVGSIGSTTASSGHVAWPTGSLLI